MAPLPLPREELIELANSGCAIRLPPRFLFCPRMAETMDRALTPFVCATLPRTGSYTFDVWRVPSVTLKGPQAQQQLRGLAEEHVRGGTNEGGADVEIESVELHRTHRHLNNINKIALQITAKPGKQSANLQPDATRTNYGERYRQGEDD